jgi:hypothetical protein
MNPHRSIARIAATAFVTVSYLALSAVSVGCGGSNNTSSEGTTTVVSTFTPDTPIPANGSITMLAGTTSGASVNVLITVTQIPSFFGAAFRVTYDPTALLFNGMDNSTSFLRNGISDDSQLFFTFDAANSPGEVVITATRLFPAVPVNVTTTSNLVILNFVARRSIIPAAVEGRLDFADPKQACDGTVAAPGCGSITVTSWNGGGVSAQ